MGGWVVGMEEVVVASSAQYHQEDGPTSSLGPVSMGKEQRAVCSGGLVAEVEAAVLLKLGLSLSTVEEVVDEPLHRECVSENGGEKESRRALVCRHAVPD